MRHRYPSIRFWRGLGFLLCCAWSQSYALSLQYDITGLKGPLLQNSVLRLQIKQAAYGAHLTDTDAKRLAHEGIGEIQKAIEPYGYFNADFSMTLDKQGKAWVAHYVVNPGAVLPVRELTTILSGEGKSDPEIKRTLTQFQLKQQQPFTTQAYDHDVSLFDKVSSRLGYIKASTRGSTIAIHRKENWADVNLHLDTGARYYFGPVTFSNDTYNLRFLRRFIPFEVGQPFSTELLGTFRRDLLAADLFQSVSIDKLPPFPDYPTRIPLKINVIPEKPYNYYTGLGIDSDEGLRTLFGIRIRRIRDQGQHVDFSVRATRALIDSMVSYTIPGYKPVTDYYTIESHFQSKQQQEIGDSRIINLGVKSVKELGEWHQELGLYSLREHSYPVSGPDYLSVLVYPKASYSRTWFFGGRLHPIETLFTVSGGSKAFFSDINFAQLRGEWRLLQPITTSGRLRIENSIAKTWGANLTDLPLSLQFLTGGANSVRGYRYNSIGPGLTSKTLSIEWQQEVRENWYALVFLDQGSASAKLSGRMLRGPGVGGMLHSAVGDIELTYARAWDLPARPWRVQFSINRMIGRPVT